MESFGGGGKDFTNDITLSPISNYLFFVRPSDWILLIEKGKSYYVREEKNSC